MRKIPKDVFTKLLKRKFDVSNQKIMNTNFGKEFGSEKKFVQVHEFRKVTNQHSLINCTVSCMKQIEKQCPLFISSSLIIFGLLLNPCVTRIFFVIFNCRFDSVPPMNSRECFLAVSYIFPSKMSRYC